MLGTESGTVSAASILSDSDFQVVVAGWAKLPEAIKSGILAIAADAPATLRLRISSGNVTHADGSTLFHPGICPAHGDKLSDVIFLFRAGRLQVS